VYIVTFNQKQVAQQNLTDIILLYW